MTKFEKISQDLSEAQENLNTVKKEIETLLAKFEEGNQAEKKQAELERLAQNKMYAIALLAAFSSSVTTFWLPPPRAISMAVV